MLIGHSDEARELSRLEETKLIIASEAELIEPQYASAAADVRQKRIESGGAFSDELAVAEILYAHKDQSLRNLRLAKGQAYFTRVDFIPDASGGACEKHTYYIGKWGVLRSATLDQVVVDWRAPIANLYYSGQIGPMRYEAPDGVVFGELTLKRQFNIEQGTLKAIFDTGVAGVDTFLQSVLGEARGDKLREVVATLQTEQNDVIRAPLDEALIVQGAAGSGKTTIALHRIAYLLYAHRDILLPRNVLILAPNPLFLDYISSVLPELGVEQVEQTTFIGFTLALLQKRVPQVEAEAFASDTAISDEDARADMFEGSLRYYDLLQKYLDDLEPRVLPDADIVFGPVVLYTYDQLNQIFLTDLSPFPYARRLEEAVKYVSKKLKPATERVIEWIEEECAKRADSLSAKMPDGEERQQLMRSLYDSRDQRVAEAKNKSKTFLKDFKAGLPALGPVELYREFLSKPERLPLAEDERAVFETVARRALAVLDRKRARVVDLAPLCVIERRMRGLPRRDTRHVVIDEAQDVSPFQYRFLRDMLGHDSFTIVGDLMQGINNTRAGLQDWRVAQNGAFAGHGGIHNLRVSYRSTLEIMTLANSIARKFPLPHVEPAQPLPRAGAAPRRVYCEDVKRWREAVANELELLTAAGHRSVALIERTQERAKALAKRMNLPLLDAREPSFKGGILVAPASHTKGLEFDAVVVCDASEVHYPPDDYHARLLYVCATRALHSLTIIWTGELTELLKA